MANMISKADVTQAEADLQEALQTIGDEIQLDILDVQKKFHECAVRCHDRYNTLQRVSSCLQECSIPMQNLNAAMERDVSKFQEKVQRSMLVCQDKVQDLSGLSENEMAQSGLRCIYDTFQEHIQFGVPKLKEKMKTNFRGI